MSSAAIAGAGILDLDLDAVGIVSDAEGDGAARRRGFDGVAQQILEDLIDAVGVGVDVMRSTRTGAAKASPMLAASAMGRASSRELSESRSTSNG